MGVSEDQQQLPHVLLISFPGQGHVNPLLRLGKRLASRGLLVTFSTTESVGNKMKKADNNISGDPTPFGAGKIQFEFFSEEWEDEDPRRYDLDVYLHHLELVGKEALRKMIDRHAANGNPVSCLINNPFIPWVSDVADTVGIPCAMLWVQSCACLSAYYHYYYNDGSVIFPSQADPEVDVKLPYMPLLKHDEIPSFLCPDTPYPSLRRAILGQFKNLSKSFCVLMDTFKELEKDVVEYMSKLCPIKPVGPLFKYCENDIVSKSSDAVRGDFLKPDDECIGWLDKNSASSVVYISFGSVVILKQEQVDEIAYGLLSSGLPFLWVLKEPPKDSSFKPFKLPDEFLENVGEKGKVVQWSPQEKVLAHHSVACFVTHCGWNSTMEALTNGVPVAAFPQWGDQVTDAKYLVDVFKVGIRMCRGEAENRIITRYEVDACLREAMRGPKAAEMKENASRWKASSEEAVAEGGSSYRNLQEFVDEVNRISCAGSRGSASNTTTSP